MALFRKFFYRKPPEGLLEISEGVYVFDCCFSVDVLGDDKYRDYVGGLVTKLCDYWPDGSFVILNFLDGKNHSCIAEILAEYDITVMDYPMQYENCPVLTLEMIDHFLKSSESWLDLGERNSLLLHCERGGWPVLVFALAALLICRKQYTGGKRTLDLIYKQASSQLLQLVSPLNPLPSQLRYLQYVSGRILHSEWPTQIRPLMLDCMILRVIPSMDAKGGCRPIFRMYGLDPVMEADQIPKMLLSTPKNSKVIRHYKQADCDLVKIDINCQVKGDIVIECITLDHELQLEKTLFRIMFNTAFIKSNVLKLSRDEIDTLWNVLDYFSRDFRVEILFSEMDSSSSGHSLYLPVVEDEGGSWFEAFAKPQGTLSDVDNTDEKTDAERNVLKTQENLGRVLGAGKDNLDYISSQSARNEILESCSPEAAKVETPNSKAKESDVRNSYSKGLEEQGTRYSASLVLNSRKQNMQAEDPQAPFPRIIQPKIISPRILLGSLSNPASNSLQESPSSLSRYQNTHSALGITALLHDTSSNNKVGSHMVTLTPRSSLSASFPRLCKSTDPSLVSLVPPSELRPPSPVDTSSPAPPPPLAPSALLTPSQVLLKSPSQSSSRDSTASKELHSPKKFDSNTLTLDTGYSGTASCPPAPPLIHSGMSLSLAINNSISPPPPLSVFSRRAASVLDSSTSSLLSPHLPPFSSPSYLVPTTTVKNASILPPLHKIASTANTVPDKISGLEIAPVIPPPQSVHSVSGSNSTVKASSLPSSVPTLSSSSSSPSPFTSTNCSSLSTTTIIPLFSLSASSSDQISLIVPQNNLKTTTLPSEHVGSVSIVSATALVPQPAPPAQSQPPNSLREALSPVVNLSSLPTSIHVACLNGSISLLPEKSSKTVARPPQPPPPPSSSQYSRALLNSAATSSSQPAPAVQSQPAHSLTEALSPNMNSCATRPASPGVASLSTSISSVLPGKSKMVARPTQPPPPPPPPSLYSRAFSNSAASSAPTPPAPRSPPKESISKISPKIPPPPAPLSSAFTKPGATLQSNSCGRNGNIPPTPALPVGAKGRLQPIPAVKPESQTKKSSLKPYHWLKLTRALQGSIWAETRKPEEASKTPEFDISELESLFSANLLSSDHGSTKGISTRASKSKSDKVNLIEFRRAYNCEIMLTKIKIPLADIMSSVLSLDDSALDSDQVDNLIKFCPTKEEIELLKNYNGDVENLGKCEQFLLEMMKVPRAELKLRVFSFKIQFHSRVSDLRSALNLVNSASEEVRNSVKLKRIMQSILSLGNALNHGTARGSAVGFRLDSLLKLSDTRAHNNKMTLMHYLCKVLSEKLPELLDFPKDLMSLEAATRIQLKYLAEEMQAISKGLEKVAQELTASENDGPVSNSFCKTLKEFLHSADTEVRSLASLYSVVGRNADALAQYFGEDPARGPFEQVICTLLNFVRMFTKAHKENCKLLEVEKKRAQKESENERANSTAPTTEPDENKSRTNGCSVSKRSIQHR